MATKFKVIKQIECGVCHGAGKFEHPDGDIEWCALCGRKGYWESEVSFQEALDEMGVQTEYLQPVTDEPTNRAATLDDVVSALADIADELKRMRLHQG